MKCEICESDIKIKGFSSHLNRKHNINSNDYYDKYFKKDNEGICKECNNATNFKSLKEGYYKFCSCKCSSKSDFIKYKTKLTILNKKNNSEYLENINKKRKKTNLKKYGVENISQVNEIKNKKKEIFLKKYGVDHPSKSKEIKEKKKETSIKKWGTIHPLQNKEIKEKQKQTCLEKYGVDNIFQNKEIKEKQKQTCLEKYGVEYILQNKEIKEKLKKTNLERYGVEYASQSKEIKEKQKQNRLKNFILKINNIFKYLDLELISNYLNNTKLINVKCLKCNTEFETQYSHIQQGHGKCPNCFPKYKSNIENELLEFIKSIENSEIIENSRDIISPYELDIYIPEKDIAIEFNGLYWHSEKNIIDKNYHLLKTDKCINNDIILIHIFEDEWIYKQDIVKSRLKQILNINNSERIHARKCTIKEINPKDKNEFFNKYHIQGEDKSNIKLGAFYDDELISIMTFSKGNISKGSKNIEGIWELNRFCSNSNYHIPGIASKLLSHFKKNYKWKEIFSYADRRWSDGNVYKKLGFKLEHITKPNYWYIKGINRIHRFNLRKKSNEPKDIPEWILRQKEGYFRIWDCGHYKFIMENKND